MSKTQTPTHGADASRDRHLSERSQERRYHHGLRQASERKAHGPKGHEQRTRRGTHGPRTQCAHVRVCREAGGGTVTTGGHRHTAGPGRRPSDGGSSALKATGGHRRDGGWAEGSRGLCAPKPQAGQRRRRPHLLVPLREEILGVSKKATQPCC